MKRLRTLKSFQIFKIKIEIEKPITVCAANFSFAQLAKRKSLGLSKPATNSQAQSQDVSELGYLFHDSPVCI
jgi:hypothetical protein